MEIELLESPDMLDVSPKNPTGLAVQAAREVAAAPSVPSGPMANAIAFLQAGGTMETLERMMAMQKEHNAALAEQAYNASFAAFKAEAVRIVKAKEVTAGPLSGKSYAELFNVVDAVTPALSRHGLSASWKITKDEPQWIEVTCTLKHIDGHSESVAMGGPPDSGGAKNKIQERASTVSYLQRYTLKAVCGVAEGGQDDDGNGGQQQAEIDPVLLQAARDAAMGGWKAFAAWIKGRTEAERKALDPESANLKAAAKAADKAPA